jgi:hypothetical protein
MTKYYYSYFTFASEIRNNNKNQLHQNHNFHINELFAAILRIKGIVCKSKMEDSAIIYQYIIYILLLL